MQQSFDDQPPGKNTAKLIFVIPDSETALDYVRISMHGLSLLRLIHTTLQICCDLQRMIAFLQGDRKFSISAVFQTTATVAVTYY